MDEDEADEDDEDNDDVVGGGGGGSENGEEVAAPPQPAVKVKRVVSTTNNLARFLEYLLKLLQKKDTNEFFANPVNDQFAPGYSSIIKQPMDFSTIRYSRLLHQTRPLMKHPCFVNQWTLWRQKQSEACMTLILSSALIGVLCCLQIQAAKDV